VLRVQGNLHGKEKKRNEKKLLGSGAGGLTGDQRVRVDPISG